MFVKIYDCEGDKEILTGQCELSECFPDAGDDYAKALRDLQRDGRTVVGGGAAPLVVLVATPRIH
jgi:hypothetical protein